jgi:hypothetical protein
LLNILDGPAEGDFIAGFRLCARIVRHGVPLSFE